MELNQPTSSEQNPIVKVSTTRNKIPVTICFLIGSLLFFLPFVEIKCNGTSLATASGIDLAMGFEAKPSGSLKSISDWGNNNDNSPTNTQSKKQDPNQYAIAALALGVLGLIITLLAFRSARVITGLVGILALIAMIVLMIDVKSKIKEDSTTQNDMGTMTITADFTVWYYLSVIAFLAAAIFSFIKQRTVQTAIVQPNTFPVTSSAKPPGTE